MNPRIAEEFPRLCDMTYLNTAQESPLMASARSAMLRYQTAMSQGEPGRTVLRDVEANAKILAARLIDSEPEEIAFVSSCARGVAAAIHSLQWKRGSNIVIPDLEFPTNLNLARSLARDGVDIRVVPSDEGRIEIGRLGDFVDTETRAILVSHVSYKTGFTFDLRALRALSSAAGAYLIVDATQAVGAIPVEAQQCDFVITSGFKWLLGPHGIAILFVNGRTASSLQPRYVGWKGVATSRPDGSYEVWPDARRYEDGMPNYLGMMVLENALGFLLSIGRDVIERHVHQLMERLMSGLGRLELEILTPQEPAEQAGIASFAANEPLRVRERLARQGVEVFGGDGRIRISPHIYNDEGDVDTLLNCLEGCSV